MNKLIRYLFIFILLVSFPKEAPANTDILNNVLTTINSTLKEVGEVQNKISGKVRKVLSMKVSPEALIGSLGGKAMLDKAEKLKEVAENAKEKAEKYKEIAETAKEKKDEYMAKYQELNEFATQKFAEANEAFDNYKAIYEEYKAKAQEYIAVAKDVVEVAAVAGAAVGGAVSAIKGAKEGGASDVAAKASDIANLLGMENISNKIKGDAAQVTPVDTATAEMSKIEDANITEVTAVNRADVISSAGELADRSMLESKEAIIVPDAKVLEASEVNITSKDIMDNIASQKAEPLSLDSEVKTDINLKDQLTNTSNKALKISDEEKMPKVELEEAETKQDKRAKFGEIKASAIEAKSLDDAKLNADKSSDKELKAKVQQDKTLEAKTKLKEEIASTKGFKEKAKAETTKLKASAIKDKIEKSSVKMSAEKQIKKQPKIQDKKLKTKEKINAL